MAVELKVPPVGESITEGRVARWVKPDGAMVRADETVLELETDKASQDIAAPADGVIKHLAKVGDVVLIGQTVALIETNGSPVPSVALSAPSVSVPPSAAPAAPEPILSPAAKRIVAEQGIDPASITGTGRGGRVTKEDALAAKASPPVAPTNGSPLPPPTPIVAVTAPDKRETRTRMTGIRARIAERLVMSQQTTATLTTFNEVDLSAVSDLRTKYKDKFKEKHGVNLGFMSFFVKAAVEALKAFPIVNSRIDGEDIVTAHYYDIGVAVSTERGLMVPIVRDADQLRFADIEKKIGELATKAREGKISVADLQGGTFTITNGGIFGSLLSTPILNPPQSAILGMHTIQKRPVVVNDAVVIRPMMYLALSYDHRLLDGKDAVQFLVRIKECLESPERLLLEI